MRINSGINYLSSAITPTIPEGSWLTSMSQNKKVALVVAAIFAVLALVGGVVYYFKSRDEKKGPSSPALNKQPPLPLIRVDVPAPHKEKVKNAIFNLASDLCNRLAVKQKNASFAISPISIIAVLGMGLHIIPEEKKAQYLNQLGLAGLSEGEAHAAIADALHSAALPKDFKQGTIEVSQAVARKENVQIADHFNTLVHQTYGADSIYSNEIMKEANAWASEKTHGKIPVILPDNTPEFVLLNAVYLNLNWQNVFTKPTDGWTVENFTFADGTQAPVSKMCQSGRFKYTSKEAGCDLFNGIGFSMLEIPYFTPQGRMISQVVFLPDDPKDLPELEKKLTNDYIPLCRSIAQFQNDVILKMPKTKMENSLELKEHLTEMGLPLDAIDRRVVDTAFIPSIVHKTFVASNEEGTEAAAVTAELCMRGPPGDEPEPEPVIFDMKHSYAYLIMDGDTLLFRGRVSDKGPLVVDGSSPV